MRMPNVLKVGDEMPKWRAASGVEGAHYFVRQVTVPQGHPPMTLGGRMADKGVDQGVGAPAIRQHGSKKVLDAYGTRGAHRSGFPCDRLAGLSAAGASQQRRRA